MKDEKYPLCVDLDGSLIFGDTLLESIFLAIKKKPVIIFLLFFWIIKGKNYFKHRIGEIALPNPASLNYRKDVLEFIKNEKSEGRKIVLATATIEPIAQSVADHLNLFDEVLASKAEYNLRHDMKRSMLVEKFKEKGYDYIGDSFADLPVWKSARNAIAVHPSEKLKRKAAAQGIKFSLIFNSSVKSKLPILKQLRTRQWVKNLLLLLPLALAHRAGELNLLLINFAAFFAFCFAASFVYVINDLMDIEADRQHPTKKLRPLASSSISVQKALAAALVMLTGSMILAFGFLPLEFILLLLSYLILTTLYSFWLKKIYIIDIIVLSSLYTLRLLAGSVSVNVPVSDWLLEFSLFMFLSLAILKRYAELHVMVAQNKEKSEGRGYLIKDIGMLRSLGTSSGYISVLVMVLYIHSPENLKLYQNPLLLLPVAICLLFWITRIWFKAHRGEMTDDPIVFTVKDPVSYIIGLIILILVIGAAL
jgi:4-hydroxybenzoate polyprenyltransferase